jgi:L-rhamnose mutarotase
MEQARVTNLSLFRQGNQLFLYYECHGEEIAPELLLPDAEACLAPWPGADAPRLWVPMLDIFHYQQPVSGEHWARTTPGSTPFGRLARLKPEHAARYIFYHYQYQEERPGDGDKYGIIALHENLMFFYSERPATVEPAPYQGKLATSHTPANWGEVMHPHFIMWNKPGERELIWLEIQLVLQA